MVRRRRISSTSSTSPSSLRFTRPTRIYDPAVVRRQTALRWSFWICVL
jgi:hypothetical protein